MKIFLSYGHDTNAPQIKRIKEYLSKDVERDLMRSMRRVLLFIAIFVPLTGSQTALAQIQHGVVKTRGRMVNGELQPGRKIVNALVCVRGRSAVKSGVDGSFSFPVSGSTFFIDSVKKNDYALIDYEACRQYRYPQSPFVLLMETPEQQKSDLLAAERRIRRNLQRQLQEREDEIENLKNASQQEKDSLLRILYQQQGDNEKLIADMAKRYSTLDYDLLDEFYRRVSNYIENGELTRADSLLRTRGDVNSQVEAQLHKGQTIQEQKDQLMKAEIVHQSDNKELARRCYSYYENFFAQYQNDSAAHYLELRAMLDTTNVEWQNEVANFVSIYVADDVKAIEYYNLALRHSILQYGEESEWTAELNQKIGTVYWLHGDHQALEYLEKTLSIIERNFGNCYPNIALLYNNIGYIYADMGGYNRALELYAKALTIWEKELGCEHPNVTTLYDNIGFVYENQGDYSRAFEYYEKVLAIREKVFGPEHPDVAISYNNIGTVYADQGDYAKALDYYQKALAIREKVFGREHPNTKAVKSAIMRTKYKQALATNAINEFLSEHAFTATVVKGDFPARKQGMDGEYILLEFSDWMHESPTSLFDKNDELRGKPKDIVVMKDGKISKHHFENTIGVQLGIKEASKDERKQIDKIYADWKRNNRE